MPYETLFTFTIGLHLSGKTYSFSAWNGKKKIFKEIFYVLSESIIDYIIKKENKLCSQNIDTGFQGLPATFVICKHPMLEHCFQSPNRTKPAVLQLLDATEAMLRPSVIQPNMVAAVFVTIDTVDTVLSDIVLFSIAIYDSILQEACNEMV